MQAYSVRVETNDLLQSAGGIWDVLQDRGLQVMSCCMNCHGSGRSSSLQTIQQHEARQLVQNNTDAEESNDLYFVVLDKLQELGTGDQRHTVAALIMDACCHQGCAACSVNITECASHAVDASEGVSCCPHVQRQPSGCAAEVDSDCYLEQRADGVFQ